MLCTRVTFSLFILFFLGNFKYLLDDRIYMVIFKNKRGQTGAGTMDSGPNTLVNLIRFVGFLFLIAGVVAVILMRIIK